ncbi:MAG TPA: NUDIX hydrolase [Gemmatimonadaceae bacterium]|nr:NUDIX hydrolase [Gemmatimonadaceae bacterium]
MISLVGTNRLRWTTNCLVDGHDKQAELPQRLPQEAQEIGDSSTGEIEIVTSRKAARTIAAKCANELKGSGLGKGGKTIGILLEDETRMIVRDPLRFPSGATGCRMRVIGKTEFDGPNGVAVLAMSEGRFVLREIYRHATRSWELECTRGRRETGMTPRQTVRAEVKQELGFAVKKIHLLGMIRPDSALMSAHLEVFLVELGARGKPEPEETEAFGEIVYLTADELADRILDGTIKDSYTISALLLAQLKGLVPLNSDTGNRSLEPELR